MRKLVAFYSRAGENYYDGAYRYLEIGNTEKAAHMIAEVCGADLFKIEQLVPYADDYKNCVAEASGDWKNDARPELKNWLESISDYDEIYLGYPNYCGTMPMAVYTFLEKYNWEGKTIHPFCTHEGSGMGKSEKEIARIVPNVNLAAGLALKGCKVDEALEEIKAWCK